jgi:hypothetical protein
MLGPAMVPTPPSNSASGRKDDSQAGAALAGSQRIEENGGGPRMRLRKRHQKKS